MFEINKENETMKIGILAYHFACNFGATLQLLSTYTYLLNHGHEPVIINWIPSDLEDYYNRCVPKKQLQMQKDIRKQLWNETKLCRTSHDVADVAREESFDCVIIGSDAVCQNHSFLERLVFPCSRIVALNSATTDMIFPNAFWADWLDYMDRKIPVCVISVSSQDSVYKYFSKSLRKEMERMVNRYSYMSVRDTWTQNMISHITSGKFVPEVTPDPVFAFNYNAKSMIPSRETILKRFNLPEKYVLLSFINSTTVDQNWIDDFSKEVRNRMNAECVMLTFAHASSFGKAYVQVEAPLSPVDWYALIKYSAAYVGHNMHPIVVSLHNSVAFFSFDNYGTKRFNGLLTSDKSSKILHVLKSAGLESNRITCLSRYFKCPSPSYVCDRILSFNYRKCADFANSYYDKYQCMMNDVLKVVADSNENKG